MNRICDQFADDAQKGVGRVVGKRGPRDIEADAEINNGIVGNINSGTVKKDGSQVATFNSYGNENLSINHNVGDKQEQCNITAAVNTFIADTKAKIATAQPVSL